MKCQFYQGVCGIDETIVCYCHNNPEGCSIYHGHKNDLRPCPFCGRNKHLEILESYAEGHKWYVLCNFLKGGCGAMGGCRITKESAIRAWNTGDRGEESDSDGRVLKLNQNDIRDILAEHFDVSIAAVKLTPYIATVGYGLNEHEAPQVSCEVTFDTLAAMSNKLGGS